MNKLNSSTRQIHLNVIEIAIKKTEAVMSAERKNSFRIKACIRIITPQVFL